MAHVISLTGYSLLAATLILTVMIAPLMTSIFSDGLRAVRKGWLEGSLALGINRWRTFWKIAVRPPARQSSPARSSPRLARWARRSCSRWSPGRSRSPPTRSTAPSSSTSRRGPRPDDHHQHRRPLVASREGDAVRNRGRAAVLRRDAVVRRLGGEGSMRGTSAAHDHGRRQPVRAPPPPPGARASRSAGDLAPQRPARARRLLGLGVLFCVIAAAIVMYFMIQGLEYLRPHALTHPHQRLQPGSDRRLPRTP